MLTNICLIDFSIEARL